MCLQRLKIKDRVLGLHAGFQWCYFSSVWKATSAKLNSIQIPLRPTFYSCFKESFSGKQ